MIGEIALWLFLYTQRKVRDQLGYYEEIDCTGVGGGGGVVLNMVG